MKFFNSRVKKVTVPKIDPDYTPCCSCCPQWSHPAHHRACPECTRAPEITEEEYQAKIVEFEKEMWS